MALQVWLPLNGDLNNYGVSGLKVVQTTTPTYINGKIGKAMSTGAFYLPAADVAKFYNGNTMSWAFWIYPTTSGSLSYPIIGNASTSTSSGNRMYTLFQYPNGVDFHLSWRSETSETTTFLNAVYSNAFTVNTWNHCVVTYDNPTCKVYINGELKQTYSGANTRTNFNYDVPVGSTSGRYLNDIRIYDHCLSPKEVKEISKALIVHYPMNGGGKGLPNYLVNSNFYNKTSSWGGVNGSSISVVKKDGRNTITATKGTSNMLICQGMSTYSYTKNTTITFTISADVYTEVEGTLNVGNWITTTEASGWQGMNLTEIWNTPNTLHVGWNHISVTHKNASKQYTGTIITGFGYTGTTCFFTNIKFEFSDKETPWMPYTGDAIYNKYVGSIAKEYDTSGFGYDATVVGSLELTSDTPRYKIATGPFGSGKGLYCSPHPCQRADGNPITVSCWFKQAGRSGYQEIVCNRDGSGYNWMLYTHTTDGSIQFHGDAQYKSSVIPSLNEWHHVVAIVYANQTYSLFLDGSKVVNATTYKYHAATSNHICVGKYGTTTTVSEPFNGYISDVRIYATALSDADAIELYKTSASIDNKGNLLTYEIVEG